MSNQYDVKRDSKQASKCTPAIDVSRDMVLATDFKTSRLLEVQSIEVKDIHTSYLLQSAEWAQIKQNFLWTPYAFRQTAFPDLASDILVLVRRVSRGIYIAYIPDGILPLHAPHSNNTTLANTTTANKETNSEETNSEETNSEETNSEETNSEETNRFEQKLHKAWMLCSEIATQLIDTHKINICTLRWDMPWVCKKSLDAHIPESLREAHKKFSAHNKMLGVDKRANIQAPATIVLDIRMSSEALLAAMKQKTRYNIRLATKKGVQIRNNLSLGEFYSLYEYTSKRNKIAIHHESYYRCVQEIFASSPRTAVHIFGAEYEEKLIAAIFVVHHEQEDSKQEETDVYDKKNKFSAQNSPPQKHKEAVYMYGASSDAHRNLMPAYALQWHAILHAKNKGCTRYDMYGMPIYADEGHRMFGMYKFKVGFGGVLHYRLGAYDVCAKQARHKTLRTLIYKLYTLVEKIRLWYYYTYKK